VQVSIFTESYPLEDESTFEKSPIFDLMLQNLNNQNLFYSSTNLSHNSSLFFFILFNECLLLLIDLWSQETIMPPTGLIPQVARFASLPHIKAPPFTGYANTHCLRIPAALPHVFDGPT